jgi:L-erythro-3,5-diaminohexanoate dehydrogenase
LLKLNKDIERIVIIGAGGRAGVLSCSAAKTVMGEKGKIIAIEKDREKLARLRELGLADIYIELDAAESRKVAREVSRVTDGKMADLVVDVGNVSGLEAGTILASRSGGKALFFNMATNFSRATLVAEGVGLDVDLLMGNGYQPGHADFVVKMLRENPSIKDMLK